MIFFRGLFPDQVTRPKRKKSSQSVEESIREEFKCGFNADGELRMIGTDKPIRASSQAEYDRLGDLVIAYVQEKLQTEYGLKEVWIPKNMQNQCNIFVSSDWESNTEKALILIQGAGDVRAGIWSRSVCINESISLGSMLPFVHMAQQENYSIIILNPNFNRDQTNPRVKIDKNENAISHSKYVFEQFIRKSPARNWCIVGHSCGGICTLNLLKDYWEDFFIRVKAIALTDSVHGSTAMLNKKQKKFLKEKCVDWVASSKQLDVKVMKYDNGCTLVSAGHNKHEYTSGCAFPSIFPFFQEMIYSERNTYL